MATLYFKVSSDWQEVVRLRQECEKLESQLKKMDSRAAPAATKALETQLASTKQQVMGLVTEAAKAGAEIENGFKKKIYDASQTVNGLSEKIIAQRAVIKDIEFDVKRLGDAYRAALKNNPIGASGKLSEYNAARKALDEEKAALFGLAQKQAEARLSVKKLRDEYSLYKKEAGDTVEINNGLSVSWGKMLGVIGGVTALKQLGSEIIRVRGEFQSMQTAIETMVGKDMAGVLIPQIKELAKISPLTLSDMVNAEKMMLGFNIQAEDTIRYLQALSDISMGDGVKFKSLTLAFSQMSAAGKLMGQDLNQMINAGFNPLQIIAEKTGKSIATLKDEMSKGAVSAEMVQQAFIDATSAGGKFYQMSENASKTINGQLSMMQDALDAAFNEIGQASEGVIMGAIQASTSLIQNYETVGKVLAGLVATYGVYRTAVMLATIATSKHTIAEVTLTNVRVLARKAQMLLNAAMLTNPYVAVATVVTALAASIWVLSTRTSEAEKATERLNAILDEHNKKEEEHRQAVEALVSTIQDQNKAEGERLAAFEKLKAEYPSIFQNYTTEAEFLKEIVKYKQLIAQEDAKRSTQSLQEQLKVEQGKLDEMVYNRSRGQKLYNLDSIDSVIDAQQGNVNRLKAEISSPIVDTYLESIKTLKDEEIKSTLDDITLSMKALGDSGKDAIAIVASLGGEFSKEQLGMIKSALETEQKSRSSKTTYAEDYEQARKDWEEAKKELQKIEADKDNFTSKQYEDAKKRVETTEKAYKNLGGDVKGKTVKSDNSILTQQARISELEENQAKARIRQQTDLENQVAQARIDAMADGAEKERAQQELDNKMELQAIEQQKQDYIQSVIQSQKEIFDAQEELKAKQNPGYNKQSFDSSSISVDTSVFDTIYDFTREKQVNDQIREQERAWNKYLQKYGTYQQKRKAIIEKYNKEIAEAQTAGDMAIKTEEKKSALEQLDEQYGESTRTMADLFEDASEKSVSSIQRIIDKYELLVKYLSGTEQNDNTAVTTDELKAVGFTDRDIEKIEKGEISIKDLTDALKGLKEELKGKSPWQSFISDMQKGIDKLKAADKDTQKIGEGVTIIGDAVTNFAPALGEFGNSIASIFGVEDSNITEITNAIGGLGQTASGVGQIMSGDIVGGIMNGIGGISSIISAFTAIHDKKNEKRIQRLQDQIDTLDASYEKLGRSIEKAYSTDAAGLIEDQNKLLEQQKLLIQQQIYEEEEKKKTDNDRIKQWKEQLEEINQTLEENKEKMVEAITGTDVMSAIDEFAQAYADAWASGEDAAKASTEAVKSLIKTSLLEFLKKQLSPDVEEFMGKLADYMQDGIISAWEQQQLDSLKEQMDQIVGNYFDQTSSYWKDEDNQQAQQQQASAGYSIVASQDSVDVLNGRLTAMYEAELRIEKNGETMRDIAAETRSILAQSYLELVQISENTGEIIKPIKQMQLDIAEVKRNTSSL